MPEVNIRGISKSYGDIIALHSVDLDVHNGEYVCVIGPSGCGKTTLIKSIAGIVQPDTGEVFIDGKPVTQLSVEDRNTGYVFQEIALFPHMNVYDNVSYGLMVKGETPEERRGSVVEMLNMLSLKDNSTYFPQELSGGARQKTAIARALASGSTFLLLDEPLGALDLKVRASLRYELRQLVKELGLTAIHVTHDQEEAISIADKIVIMKAGKIVEIGPPDELYLNPRNIFTAKFLGEANFFVGTTKNRIDKTLNVEIGETTVSTWREEDFEIDEACVLAIRPEFVKIAHDFEGKYVNVLKGKISESNYLGELVNYVVEISPSLKVQVKVPILDEEPDIRVGDNVSIVLPEEHLLIYKYPLEGLEKELKLE